MCYSCFERTSAPVLSNIPCHSGGTTTVALYSFTMAGPSNLRFGSMALRSTIVDFCHLPLKQTSRNLYLCKDFCPGGLLFLELAVTPRFSILALTRTVTTSTS